MTLTKRIVNVSAIDTNSFYKIKQQMYKELFFHYLKKYKGNYTFTAEMLNTDRKLIAKYLPKEEYLAMLEEEKNQTL